SPRWKIIWPRRTRRSVAKFRISSSSAGCIAANSGLPSRASRFALRSSLATSVSRSQLPRPTVSALGDSHGAVCAPSAGCGIPAPERWEGDRMPALDAAVRYALAHETPWPRDLRAHLEAGFFEPPPHNEILGPI